MKESETKPRWGVLGWGVLLAVITILVANGTGWSAYGRPAEAHPYMFEMRDAPPFVVLRDNIDQLALKGAPAYVALIRHSDSILALIRQLNPGAAIRPVAYPGVSPASPVYRVN